MRSGVSHKKQHPEMSITGGQNPPIDKVYLSRMSFLTFVTPLTLRATSTAL